MKTLESILSNPQTFLSDIFHLIEKSGVDVSGDYLDHICYRVGSESEYQEKKLELMSHGKMLIESMVNGRLIATFKLHTPILFNNRKIDLVELPAPKKGTSYKSGLEHIEFVTKKPLSELVALYPHIQFETNGINKEINADITLRMPPYCIRFHNQSLEEVIEAELKMANEA